MKICTTIAVKKNVAKSFFAEPIGGSPDQGPFTVLARQGSVAAFALAFMLENQQRSDGSFPVNSNRTSHRCTKTTGENSGYTGNAALTAFTGQNLNVLPVAPYSVRVNGPAASQVMYDKFGDGRLFIQNTGNPSAEVLGGTINYANGALVLAYTVAPSAGAILVDYVATKAVGINGQQNHQLVFEIEPIGADRKLCVCGVGLAADGRAEIEVINHALATRR